MATKALPPMEHTFTIDLKGSDTGKHYSGSFTYKRANLRIKSQISKTTARLNEDLKNLDEETQFLHRMLATLRHSIEKYPEWWAECDFGFELYDENIVMEIYKDCAKFENEWQQKVWGNQEEEGSSGESKEG